MTKKMTIAIITMLVALFMAGAASAVPAPSVDICTTSPAVCASSGTTLVVYEGTDASVNPGLYAHFADWISGTPGSIWVVDTVGGATDYAALVSIDTNPKDALYGWTPDGIGEKRYKIYAHATQDPDDAGLFADVTVRTRTNSVPELPTSALTMVGLIGLIGMVRLRSKD